jgi:hypothetical protein
VNVRKDEASGALAGKDPAPSEPLLWDFEEDEEI